MALSFFTVLFIVYCLLFIALSYTNFRLAVGLFIVSLPTYLIRFNLGPFPSTLLEVSFGVLFLVWLIKYARHDWKNIQYLISNNKLLSIFCLLFFISSIISIFVSDMWYYSLGQWRAYFLEPMVLFVILVGRSRRDAINRVSTNDLTWFLVLSTISVSVFGIIQKFIGGGIATYSWSALATFRVTSFFTSPNSVGLYLGPLIFLTLALILKNRSEKNSRRLLIILILILLSSLITVAFTLSLGTWVALATGLLLFIYLLGYKKIAWSAGVSAIIIVITISLAAPALLAKEKSTQNRFTLWGYSWGFLSESPKNFLLGTGIRQFFRKVQKPFYEVKELERLIYPHNIFLNFWTEIGLIGMLSFTFITYLLFLISYKIYKNSDHLLGAALLATLTTILIHGLIDVPYFKNDLAMLWWILTALILTAYKKQSA